jgi:hypothetical protein
MKLWTEEEINILTEMWGNNCETQEIALALGRNRNSIIGKAHRLGLPEHVFTTNKRMKTQQTKKEWAKPRLPPIIPEPIPTIKPSSGVAFMDIGYNQCRAVIGRDADTFKLARFCGHPTRDGVSWCPGHLASYTYTTRGR